jgi:single-strand DNA-binding protein
MTDQITVVGNVANDPAPGALPNGAPTLRFRLATNRRRYDREKNGWVEDAPNWYSVTAFRSLAANAQSSLRVRPWENESGARGTEVEIIADALGTDLLFGVTSFERVQLPQQGGWPSAASQGWSQDSAPGSGQSDAQGGTDAWTPGRPDGVSASPGQQSATSAPPDEQGGAPDAAASPPTVWSAPGAQAGGEGEGTPF